MSVFVFVVKEAFDSPCLPQDYKDEIEISELVESFLLVLTSASVSFSTVKKLRLFLERKGRRSFLSLSNFWK